MELKTLFTAACLAAASLLAAPVQAAPAVAPDAAAPTRFSVIVEGAGPDVILVPGLSSPRTVWDGARAALAGRYRLHLVELNGFGGSPAGGNAEGAILATTVAELRRYIEANRLRRPAIVGHSMGGLIGLMLAQAAPGEVGRLMVVDALPFIGTLFDPDATVASIAPRAAAMRDMMLAQPSSPERRAAAAAAVATGMSRTEPGRALVARWIGEADPGVSAQAMYEDLLTDMRPGLPDMATPVTLVYPWDAAAVPEARARALYETAYSTVPRVEFVPVAGSYHFVMLDQPEHFNQALLRFLAEAE